MERLFNHQHHPCSDYSINAATNLMVRLTEDLSNDDIIKIYDIKRTIVI